MQVARYVRQSRPTTSVDLCTAFCALYIHARGLSTSTIHRATGGSNNATPNPQRSAPPEAHQRGNVLTASEAGRPSDAKKMTPEERTEAARQRAKNAMAEERAKAQRAPNQGGLAPNSIFADEFLPARKKDRLAASEDGQDVPPVRERNPLQMAARLDPKPRARLRWQKKMIIQEVRRSGRPTREMLLARTERMHTAKSHFFKTSVKKLAPLARQIAGKSIDEAILQMRFSSKKAAAEVQQHLIQARNEAIVMRGMGLSPQTPVQLANTSGQRGLGNRLKKASIKERIQKAIEPKEVPVSAAIEPPIKPRVNAILTQSSAVSDRDGPEISTPAETAPLPTQTPTKSVRKDVQPGATDIYIAQAWVNRGKYGFAPNHRARGRIDKLRLPYTGISVMLKEERTRTREKAEKEMRAIRKRLTGQVWTQLPDRPIVRQSQYVLW